MSTHASTAIRPPRGRRGTAAVITALVLLIVAVAAGYLAVMAALSRQVTFVDVRSAVDWLRSASWGQQVALWIGVGITVVGVILLLAALLPPGRRVVELESPDAATAAGITHRGLRRTVAASVSGIDGISHARAEVGTRAVELDAVTWLRHTDGLQEAATAAAEQRLGQLRPAQLRSVKTRLHRKES